jgi:iron complex transport system permease protein
MRHERATRNRVTVVTAASLIAVVLCIAMLPLIGSAEVSYAKAWAGVSPDYEILFQIRLSRVLLAIITGGALSLAGVLFQSLLREALATPYTLGVSAGASLGAVLAICLGWSAIWLSSIAAAMLTLLAVLGVGAQRRMISPFTLLMAGITINSICMAGILFLHNIATLGQSIAITRWLMGGIESVELEGLAWLAAPVIAGAVWTFFQGRNWNALAVGDEWAAIRGVPANRLMLSGYLVGSLLTGAVTSFTGPIGFVGLIVPHALRMSIGADHRLLIPSSFLLGGAFLALCDTVARVVLAPADVPVGVITAMLGGPFFIWILRTR